MSSSKLVDRRLYLGQCSRIAARWDSTWKPQAARRSSSSQCVRRRQPALDRLDREREHPEPAAAGEVGIELAETAGGGVARVGEERLALLLPLPG